MKFPATMVAAAALTIGCLGNDYPAKADISHKEQVAYDFGLNSGYALGLVAGSCIHYAEGDISRKSFRITVEIANELDETTPGIRRRIVDTITNNSTDNHKICIPIVRSVMGTAPVRRGPYQSADYWR